MSLKLPLAQHGLLGVSGSGAPALAVAFHSPAFAGKPEAFRHTKMETQAPAQPATGVFHWSFGSQQVPFSEKVTEDIIHFLKLKC